MSAELALNRKFLRACWHLEKEDEYDLEKRNRCSGGMPSHLYANDRYDEAMEDFRKVALHGWSALTRANREHALAIAQDECNGCPQLLEDLHKMLVMGFSYPPGAELGDDLAADAGKALDVLREHRKRKKTEYEALRKASLDDDDDDDKDYDEFDDYETDYEEWTAAGLGRW